MLRMGGGGHPGAAGIPAPAVHPAESCNPVFARRTFILSNPVILSRYVAQPVVSFRHDRGPLLARKDLPPNSPRDDGTVIAQYGATKVYVNLGDVPRTVGGHALGPYGWKIEPAGSAF